MNSFCHSAYSYALHSVTLPATTYSHVLHSSYCCQSGVLKYMHLFQNTRKTEIMLCLANN